MLIDILDEVFVHLEDRAVEGIDSVVLVFAVCDFGIDGSDKSVLLLGFVDVFFKESSVFLFQFFFGLRIVVGEIAFEIGMSLDFVSETSDFGIEEGLVLFLRLPSAAGDVIGMDGEEIGLFGVIPSGGRVDKPGSVFFLDQSIEIVGIEFAPAFIEDGTDDDARIVVEEFDPFLHFALEFFSSFFVFPGQVFVVYFLIMVSEVEKLWEDDVPESIFSSSVDKVLDEKHAFFVAVVIEHRAFDLDVFS